MEDKVIPTVTYKCPVCKTEYRIRSQTPIRNDKDRWFFCHKCQKRRFSELPPFTPKTDLQEQRA